MKARFAKLTDVPPGFERGIFGGIQPAKIKTMNMDPNEIHGDAESRIRRLAYARGITDSAFHRRIGNADAMDNESRSACDGIAIVTERCLRYRGDSHKSAGCPRGATAYTAALEPEARIEELTTLRVAMERVDTGN